MGILDKFFRKNRSSNAVEEKGTSKAVEDTDDRWRSDPGQLHRDAPFDSQASPAHSTIALDCFQLWFSNPTANRIIQILTDFMIGEGYKVTSKNEEVEKYLNEWGNDPTVNAFVLAEQWANDEMILGEYGLIPKVNEISGFVRLEPIDITSISEVFTRYGMPQLVKVGAGASANQNIYKLRQDDDDDPKNLLTIVYEDKNPTSPSYGALKGDLIFSQINTTTLLSRGYSILLTLRDWIRANDDFIYNELSRAVALRKFFIHLKVNGASEAKLKEYEKKYAEPPPAGTMIVSNDKEEWAFLSPSLNAGDTSTLNKTIRNLILTGGGIAEHWLAEGGDVNRATASEMSKPILRRLTRYQAIFFRFVEQVFRYARDQAILAGAIPGVTMQTPDIDIEIIPDPIAIEDEAVQWAFFKTLIEGLATGITSELVTDKEAREVTSNFLSEMGIDVEKFDNVTDEKLQKTYSRYEAIIKKAREENGQKSEG